MRKYSEWYNALKATKGTNTKDPTEISEDFHHHQKYRPNRIL